jgi:hypothetical protein
MAGLRIFALAALVALGASCTSPSPRERTEAAEIGALAPLRRAYPGVVMGFDLKGPATLIVSVDLQAYIDTDDDAIAAMQRAALTRWRTAWNAAHPHERAVLHVRFIDFIGRTVAQVSSPSFVAPKRL